MREIRVVHDTAAFHEELRRSGDGRVPVLQRKGLAAFGPNAYVLTGNNTREYRGGQSGTGYVIADGKAKGSISIDRSEIAAGKIIIR